MKTVNEAELAQAVPVPSPVAPMTRKEKLLRWAELVRNAPYPMRLYHLLENCSRSRLDEAHVYGSGCAFDIAFSDPVLREQGLTEPTIGGVMNFMEITQQQLHEFSCDCGGHISNDDMANRIEGLARGEGGGPLGYVRALFSR